MKKFYAAPIIFFGLYLTLAEGFVFGIGAKMFVIAGPVIVYGLVTAFGVGLVRWFRIFW